MAGQTPTEGKWIMPLAITVLDGEGLAVIVVAVLVALAIIAVKLIRDARAADRDRR